jgi:hypothetical protein
MATGAVAFEHADEQTTTGRTARQIILQAALLGVLADNLLRHPGGGVGWTAWVASLAVVAIVIARHRQSRITRSQYAWLGAAVLCAGGLAWRDAEMLKVLDVFGTLAALSLAAMTFARVPALSIWSARIRDVIGAGVAAALDTVTGVFPLMRQAEVGEAVRSSAANRKPALRAALLTAPIVIVFTMLLSRADPVFGAVFSLPEFEFDELVSHVVIAGFFAWTSAGFLRGSMLGKRAIESLPAMPTFSLGVVDVTAALGSVAALFAIFVGLQLRWLFGGADVVLATTGLSLAEYARRGFFELVVVAALVLPLILGSRAMLTDDAAMQRHRNLSLVLLGLLGAIITSAVLRMQLYVANYGMSTDRLYALVFMLWLAVVFAAMLPTVLRGWTKPFAAITVISGFGTLFALNAVNPEAIVARANVNRTSARGVDYAYLSRLSGDAMPVVAPAVAAAAPSPVACQAAKRLWDRWTSPDRSTTDLGSRKGIAAVGEHLSYRRVQELCVHGDDISR